MSGMIGEEVKSKQLKFDNPIQKTTNLHDFQLKKHE